MKEIRSLARFNFVGEGNRGVVFSFGGAIFEVEDSAGADG